MKFPFFTPTIQLETKAIKTKLEVFKNYEELLSTSRRFEDECKLWFASRHVGVSEHFKARERSLIKSLVCALQLDFIN